MLQLLLIDKKITEVLPLLNQAGHLVDSWTGSIHQKEYLKVFFLVLQVKLLYVNHICIKRFGITFLYNTYILLVGMPLLNGRTGEEREALPEAVAAEHTNYYGVFVA